MGSVLVFLEPNRTEPKKSRTEPIKFLKISNRTGFGSVRFGSVRFQTEPVPSLIVHDEPKESENLIS